MTEPKKQGPRNRAAEAREQGKRLQSFILGPETDRAIDRAVEYLAGEMGRCSRVQAVEWLVRQGEKKIPKKQSD